MFCHPFKSDIPNGKNCVSGTPCYEFIILLSNLTEADVLEYTRLLDGQFVFRQRGEEGSLGS